MHYNFWEQGNLNRVNLREHLNLFRGERNPYLSRVVPFWFLIYRSKIESSNPVDVISFRASPREALSSLPASCFSLVSVAGVTAILTFFGSVHGEHYEKDLCARAFAPSRHKRKTH